MPVPARLNFQNYVSQVLIEKQIVLGRETGAGVGGIAYAGYIWVSAYVHVQWVHVRMCRVNGCRRVRIITSMVRGTLRLI